MTTETLVPQGRDVHDFIEDISNDDPFIANNAGSGIPVPLLKYLLTFHEDFCRGRGDRN